MHCDNEFINNLHSTSIVIIIILPGFLSLSVMSFHSFPPLSIMSFQTRTLYISNPILTSTSAIHSINMMDVTATDINGILIIRIVGTLIYISIIIY